MKYHFTLVRMAIIQKPPNNKCWIGYGERGTLLHCWWECKLVQPLWRTVWRFLKTLKIVTIRSSNPTLRHIKSHFSGKDENSKLKIYTHSNVHNSTVYNSQNTETTKHPSADDWIKMCCVYIYTHTVYIHTHTYTMEYFSAIKKTEILFFAATWMDLENIMLSKISQTEKVKYCMKSLICGI